MHRILILAILTTVLAAAETAIDPCNEPTAWTFSKGDEFAGATGSLTAASGGGLKLAWDFSAGGSYLSAQPKAALPAGTVAVVAGLTADQPCTVAWRMRDANGRTFQSDYIALPAGTTRLVRTAAGPWGGSWGGKADTGPAPGAAVAFALLVDKRNGTPATGSLIIASFAAADAVSR